MEGFDFFQKNFCGDVEKGHDGSDYQMNAQTEPGRLALPEGGIGHSNAELAGKQRRTCNDDLNPLSFV